MARYLYLHGFASGPASRKARFFRERLLEQGVGLAIPDLADGDFRTLTITGQLRVVEQATRGGTAVLIGSSLGGYLAALYASRHAEIERLLLLAPAFAFAQGWSDLLGEAQVARWKETGFLSVYHYGACRELPLGVQLLEDAGRYEDFPAITQPALIFHGTGDSVVPVDLSERYAEAHPTARLQRLDSDHELLGVLDDIWRQSKDFLLA